MEEHSNKSKKKMALSRMSSKLIFREYIESLSVAIVIALILRFFVLTAYKIPTGSMTPTLQVGDFVFASKLSYGFPIPFSNGLRIGEKSPKRGDVIVFRLPSNEAIHYVKRVIGIPGDRIEIREKELIINEIKASYIDNFKGKPKSLAPESSQSTLEETWGSSKRVIHIDRKSETEFFGPVIVPPDHVFVLGDNRDSSDDSRYWGMVPHRNLEGRVFVVWLSFDWVHRWGGGELPSVRWGRFFELID